MVGRADILKDICLKEVALRLLISISILYSMVNVTGRIYVSNEEIDEPALLRSITRLERFGFSPVFEYVIV